MPKLPKISLSATQFLSLTFILLIIAGALLLTLPIASTAYEPTDLLTAFFTSTSATCVTGLTLVDTYTHWSVFGQVVILLLIQIGGLGIMSFAIFFALILGKKVQLSQRLIMQASINKTDPGGIVAVFRKLIIISFSIEIFATLALTFHWIPAMGLKKALWFGFFHAVSAFNNAGFSLMDTSMAQYVGDSVVNTIICLSVITGGLGFVVLHELTSYRKNSRLSFHTKIVLVVTAALTVFPAFVFFLTEYHHTLAELSLSTKIWASFFQVISRTSGFSSVNLPGMHQATQFMLIIIMLIGASPGSTGGGIKTTTFAILLSVAISQVRGKKDTIIGHLRISQEDISRSLSILVFYVFLFLLISFLLLATHQGNFVHILYEVCSALGTVGSSLGFTSQLTVLGKLLIIFTMFIGRIGPLTLAFALAYKNKQPDIRFPIGKITLG